MCANPAAEQPGRHNGTFPMFAEFTNHPGTITFVAPDGTETEQAVDTLPDWLKFVR